MIWMNRFLGRLAAWTTAAVGFCATQGFTGCGNSRAAALSLDQYVESCKGLTELVQEAARSDFTTSCFNGCVFGGTDERLRADLSAGVCRFICGEEGFSWQAVYVTTLDGSILERGAPYSHAGAITYLPDGGTTWQCTDDATDAATHFFAVDYR